MCKCVKALWTSRGGATTKVRGRFGEGSEKVRGRFGGAAGSHGGASARPPCGHVYGTLIILLLEPSSELAIREYFIGNMPKCVHS